MKKTPKTIPEAECQWESGALGTSEEHVVVLGAEHSQVVDEALAMQLISIRLPKELIEGLKFIAGREGLGYQPLIRRVLQRFSEAEFKSIAAEMLARERPSPRDTEELAIEMPQAKCA